MSDEKLFDLELALPDGKLSGLEKTLLGFDQRYSRIQGQLRLLLEQAELRAWNQKHHAGKLALVDLAADQYPLAIPFDSKPGKFRPDDKLLAFLNQL